MLDRQGIYQKRVYRLDRQRIHRIRGTDWVDREYIGSEVQTGKTENTSDQRYRLGRQRIHRIRGTDWVDREYIGSEVQTGKTEDTSDQRIETG